MDLLYIDTPTQSFWLRHIEHRRSVARIGDRYSGFTGVAPELLRMQQELIRSVDAVAVSSRDLETDVMAAGPHEVLHLPNGVDFEHFAFGDRTPPADLDSIRRPIVIYVGEMAQWFDYEVVDALAKAMPDVSFVMIGPDGMARRRLTPQPNLHLLGRRPFDTLPGYLHNADVGLIPFDVRRHGALVHAVHPLKLYEYLACGLPVVASRWNELERLSSPATLCDSPSEFLVAVRAALDAPPDPEAGRRFARSAGWEGRVRSLVRELDLDSQVPA